MLQFVLDQSTIDEDLPMMLRVADNTGCPITFTLRAGRPQSDRWRQTLDSLAEASATRDVVITAQVAARPVGLLLGLELSRNPFQTHPSYKAIAKLPLEEKVSAPARSGGARGDPERGGDHDRTIRCSSVRTTTRCICSAIRRTTSSRRSARSARARSARARKPEELAYDAMLEEDGRGMLYVPFLNYADGNLDAVREMLRDPHAVPGLSDGGAHCGIICDASFPTYLLTHWTRDRTRGEKLSIPFVVAAQSRRTAESVGLTDRGVLARGYKADINVIDYDRLHMHPPKVHYDLPMGGRRLLQQIDGYEATIVSGVVTQRDGKATGARPGRLVQGVQGRPG